MVGQKWVQMMRDLLDDAKRNRNGSWTEFDALGNHIMKGLRSTSMQLLLHRARERNLSVHDTIEEMIKELFDDSFNIDHWGN